MASSWPPRLGLAALVIVSGFALTGFGCRPRPAGSNLGTDATLVVWGLWQNSAEIAPLLAGFQEATGVTVEYKKVSAVADYEKKLLEALAEKRGPDIFVIHHTWVESKRALMSPAPHSVIDERALREEFVEVVADDLLREGEIYALPVSVDTLALYYNKDLLSAAGIARPPRTWDELQQVVQQLTQVTRFGTINQSALALGTAANVNRAADIIQLLFIQSGLPIVAAEPGDVTIANDIGERALTFYTDFANKSKKVYTWDLQQDYSLDAFAEGDTAMMINYSYHIPTIRAKNPRLDFAIAPLPQIADSAVTNFASYWPYTVSKQSALPDVAWQFVRYLTNTDAAQALNKAASTPTARRDGIAAAARDPVTGAFAEQALTAASWPRADIVATDAIVNTMIDSVVTGAATAAESLRRAQDQLNQLRAEPAVQFEESTGGGEQKGPGDIGFF
ncbi:MAG: extracellular solute-binding protein [Candidatus Andersenbacteria bacterium]|nr:extracellular solute-binding protein [Candidatus Andersenbacteria bacterium]